MTYNDMLTTINFNIQDPWNFDFYVYTSPEPMTEQDFVDFFQEKIKLEPGQGLPFFIRFANVYFYLPKGTEVDTEAFGTIQQITDIPTEPTPETP